MQLSDLHIGDAARIVSLGKGDPAYRKRLLAMGFLPGAILTLLRIAPLGDPIEVHVRGTALSLRKEEASLLEVALVYK